MAQPSITHCFSARGEFVLCPFGRRTATFAAADKDFGIARMVDTVAGRLAVYQVGTGSRTLVFWPSLFADHAMYRSQARALSTEYRLIFIDGFGHGASGPQSHGASIETHAEALLEVFDQLQIARAAFVGTSWGGLVGSQLARLHPHLLVALIALNTPFETRRGGPGISERMIVLAVRLFGNRGFFARAVAKSFFAPASHGKLAPGIREFKSRLIDLKPCEVADIARTVICERRDALPWLGEIAVPTTIVAGSDDDSLRAADLKRAAELIPRALFIEASDSAHLSAFEAPELVTALIREIDWHRPAA